MYFRDTSKKKKVRSFYYFALNDGLILRRSTKYSRTQTWGLKTREQVQISPNIYSVTPCCCNCIVSIRPSAPALWSNHTAAHDTVVIGRTNTAWQETTRHAYDTASKRWLHFGSHCILHSGIQINFMKDIFPSTCDGGSQLPWHSKKTPRNEKKKKKRTTTLHACNQSQLAGRSIKAPNLWVCSRSLCTVYIMRCMWIKEREKKRGQGHVKSNPCRESTGNHFQQKKQWWRMEQSGRGEKMW